MLRPVVIFLAVLLVGCAQLVPAPGAGAITDRGAAEAAWARVLARRVDDRGRVDFAGLGRDRADLDRFVAWVYENGPGNRPALFGGRADILAYHLNAYNALAMYNVLAAGVPRSIAEYGIVRFFWLRRVKVGGEPISLYRYENEVIRPLGEERVHFALNCMAVHCPHLPRQPFHAATLEADLEREARQFLNEPRNVQVDPLRRVVRLSEIFDFFPEDFLAKAPSLVAYVNRYRTAPVPTGYAVEFIQYDWTVVGQAAP